MTTHHSGADAAKLERLILNSPVLDPIIRQWSRVSLPDCWLAAGAIAQTVWNDFFGHAPHYGISDIDLVYFDAADLSEDGEAKQVERIRREFSCPGLKIDVKNEARVHLWYAQKFGREIPPYISTQHAITTFPTTATAIGVQPAGAELLISAPFGLSDLLGTIVRPNKTQITRDIYEAKIARWQLLWPDLNIIEWATEKG